MSRTNIKIWSNPDEMSGEKGGSGGIASKESAAAAAPSPSPVRRSFSHIFCANKNVFIYFVDLIKRWNIVKMAKITRTPCLLVCYLSFCPYLPIYVRIWPHQIDWLDYLVVHNVWTVELVYCVIPKNEWTNVISSLFEISPFLKTRNFGHF